MTERPEKNRRFSLNKGMGFFLVLIILCMLTGMASATTYTAADQNANGQYQIVYTVNPDNSQTFTAAGVAHGTMTSDPSGDAAAQDSGQGTGVSQDLNMNAQYGYALAAASDSSGNQADTETWLYNGQADIHQGAGVVQSGNGNSGSDSSSQTPSPGPSSGITGAYAYQCVYSRNASAIIADTDSQTTGGLAADVNAQATGIYNAPHEDSSYGEYPGGSGYSVFRVSQWAGAFTPVATSPEAYSGIRSLPSVAVAVQDGKIKGADTAAVSTSSTTPNGLSTLVSASVTGGMHPATTGSYSDINPVSLGPSYLNFDMYSSAKNETTLRSGYGADDGGGAQYIAESEADITARGDSGMTNTVSNGPNGQSADVNAIFIQDASENSDTYGIPGFVSNGKIDIDLSAYAKLNNDVTVTKVENTLSHLCSYEGSVTATNSANTHNFDTSEFDHNYHAGGVAGIVTDNTDGSVIASWAHTWPGSA